MKEVKGGENEGGRRWRPEMVKGGEKPKLQALRNENKISSAAFAVSRWNERNKHEQHESLLSDDDGKIKDGLNWATGLSESTESNPDTTCK